MDEKSYRVQIIIALIGLAGVLGAALITNWDKIFPPGQEAPPAVSDLQPAAPAERTAPQSLPADKPMKQAPPSVSPAVPTPLPEQPVPKRPKFFHGTYVGTSTEGIEEFYWKVSFVREGNNVTGSYTHGAFRGTFRGNVEGDTLYYQWQSEGYFGKGISIAKGDMVTGTWGNNDSYNNSGTTMGRLQ
jgi:hypothetical protein